jgi:hypothetical protein
MPVLLEQHLRATAILRHPGFCGTAGFWTQCILRAAEAGVVSKSRSPSIGTPGHQSRVCLRLRGQRRMYDPIPGWIAGRGRPPTALDVIGARSSDAKILCPLERRFSRHSGRVAFLRQVEFASRPGSKGRTPVLPEVIP